MLSDSSRQMVIELFLGLRLAQHLPSLHQRLHYPPPGPPEDPESDADEPYEKEGLHTARQVLRPSFAIQRVIKHDRSMEQLQHYAGRTQVFRFCLKWLGPLCDPASMGSP